MFSYVLIPLILVLNLYVEEVPVDFPSKYTFKFNRTVVRVFKESSETTLLTAKIICQHSPPQPALLCLLQDVEFLTLTDENMNIRGVLADHIKTDQTALFEINFNANGAQSIRVKKNCMKTFLAIIKAIAYLLKIDIDKIGKNLIMQYTSGYSAFISPELTPIGICSLKYKMSVVFIEKDQGEHTIENPFQIIPSVLQKYSTIERNIDVQIEKNRRYCVHSLDFKTILKGWIVNKYNYKMEMRNNKLKVWNRMDIHLLSNSSYTSKFVETTLTLIDFQAFQDKLSYDWNQSDECDAFLN